MLVGTSPDDPGLFILTGRDYIVASDVLVYGYLCNAELLRYAKSGAEKIYVGRKAKNHTMTQDEINALIVNLTGEGKVVIRLKGGDPVLFGRGVQEAGELATAGVHFEIVPGKPSSNTWPRATTPQMTRSTSSSCPKSTSFSAPRSF